MTLKKTRRQSRHGKHTFNKHRPLRIAAARERGRS